MKTFKLDNEPKIESGFKTPDSYFENFSANLMQKLETESVSEEPKVISIFRKKKNIFMAVAAILVLALMIPIAFKGNKTNTGIDSVTLENYLTQDANLNQYELIGETNLESTDLISTKNEISSETLEDVLAMNPNIENLVIEHKIQNSAK